MNGAAVRPEPTRTARLVQGAAWMYGRMVVTNVLNIAVMAILARRLAPADFGVVALAAVITQLFTLLGTEGINQFIIHDNQTGREERLQAAFWLDLALSWGCCLAGVLLLPVVAGFYEDPALGRIMLVMLLFFPVRSISKVPDALLKKGLNFKRLEIRDTLLEFVAGAASIVMVFTGFGVWSIVWPAIMAAALRAVIVYRMSDWRPRRSLQLQHWPRIIRYYRSIMGSAITSFIITDADTLLIGKLMGNTALGIYNLAWQSAQLVNRTLAGTVNKLALPAFATVSAQRDRVAAALARMMGAISMAAFPALIGLFVLADDFILVVYGARWQAAVLPLRILIIFALRHVVSPPIGALFQAGGRPEIPFRLGLANVPFYLAAIWIGSRGGIVGVALGVTSVRVVFGLVTFEITARYLHVRFRDVVSPLLPALLASGIMGTVVVVARLEVADLFPGPHLIELLTLVGIGVVTYMLLIRHFFTTIAHELLALSAPLLGRHVAFAGKVLRTS